MRGVERHAFQFHVHEHGEQRHFHIAEQGGEAFFLQLGDQHVGELQRDVGVLTGVVDHLGGWNVCHGLLVLAIFPQQVCDGNALVVQKGLRQGVHAVGLVGLEQVVGDHGVLEVGLGEVHAVPCHDFAVVLQVLAHDGELGVFEQGLEDVPDGRPCAWIDRDVTARVGFCTERHAHQRRLHGIQPRRFGVKGKALGLGEGLCQGFHAGVVVHQVVFHFAGVERAEGGGGRGHVHGGIKHAQLPFAVLTVGGRTRRRVRRSGRRSSSGDVAEDSARQGAELQFLEDGRKHVCVGWLQCHGGKVLVKVDVQHNGGQLSAQKRQLAVGLHLFFHLPFELVNVLVKAFHGTVRLQKFDGGFLPHTRNTGDVVRRIAHQSQQIDDLLGVFQAVALTHLLRTPHARGVASAAWPKHPNLVCHKLGKVLVWGHHEDVKPLFLGAFREAPNQVVRFKSRGLQHGNPHAFQDFDNPGHTELDVLRGLVPVGLVVFELFVPQGGPRRVKHHRQVRGLLRADDLEQGVGETKHRRRVHAFGVDSGVLDECVVGAEDQRIGVYQKELFLRGRGDHERGFFTRGTALQASPNIKLRTTGPTWAVNATRVAGPPAVAHPLTMTRWP